MATIRKEQLRAFEAAAARGFVDRAVRHLAEQAPRHCEILGPQATRATVETGISRAQAYGLTSERNVLLFLETMFLLRRDFDTDPEFPWALTTLNTMEHEESLRMDALTRHAWDHLDRVAGPSLEHVRSALERARREPLEVPLGMVGAPLDRWIADRLRVIYPAKCAAMEPQVLEGIVVAGGTIAVRHGLDSPSGRYVCAGLVFFLGRGFDVDPLHRWAREILVEPSTDGPSRVRRLHEAALAAVGEWLNVPSP